MRNIGKIFWECLKHNPLIWLAVVGSIFTAWLTGTSVLERILITESIHVGFLDEDKSPVSQNLYQYLTEELQMEVTVSEDADALKDLLLNTNISAIITVPEGTFEQLLAEKDWQIEITTLDDYENAPYVNAYLQTFTNSMEVLLSASEKDEKALHDILLSGIKAKELKQIKYSNADWNNQEVNRGVVQMAGIFTMLSIAVGIFITILILDDKQYGTYARIQLSAIKPVQYVIGTALLGLVAEGVLAGGIVSCYILSEKEVGISYGVFFAVFLLYGFFAIGLSLTVALLAKSKQTALSFILGFSTISCIWGGAWFPVYDNLGIISKTAMLMPVYWFMQVVRSSVGENTVQILPSVLILILFTVLIFLIAGMAFTRKKD